MESLPFDIIRETALDLSPRDVLSLCLTNKRFKDNVCNSSIFWRNKILVDYPGQMKTDNLRFTKLFQENPKDLYMLLTMNSKIVEITKDEFPSVFEIQGDDEEDFIDQLNEELNSPKGKEFIEKNFLKRGDVLFIQWMGEYRNNGKIMWDGQKVLLLDYNDDEYGSVPKEFSFPEFRPDYFSGSISHNNIVRLSPEKVEEAIRNFNVETQTSYITDKYNKYTVKLNYEVEEDELQIRFGGIFFSGERNYLVYDPDTKDLVLNVPTGGDAGGSSEKFYYNVEFKYPEWREAIIEIIPGPGILYEWEGDVLKVKGFYKD